MNHLIIADNQDITSIGIRHLVESIDTGGIDTINVTQKSVLTRLLAENPNVFIILDYTLFDFHKAEELMILSQRYPQSYWMLFSDDLTDNFLRFILANDLDFSIILKSSSLQEIELGINALFNRSQYICERTKSHMQTLNRNFFESVENNLTNTEKEILKEIASGRTTKEIAADRFLSFHTIITHRKNIFRKLGVNNVHEATKYAIRAGIVDMSEYYI